MNQQTNYTDDDTARVRAAERSSAGRETQQLAPDSLQPIAMPQLSEHAREQLGALALIAIGVLWLLMRATDQLELSGGITLLSIASVFLFFAFWRRIYGLLIPGAILAGLSAGVTFAAVTGGVSVLWGLALGFVAILLLGRALFGVRSPWPAIPAVILFGVGTIVAASQLPGLLAGGTAIFPLLLIAAGLALGMFRR
jgi:hypothetical protein